MSTEKIAIRVSRLASLNPAEIELICRESTSVGEYLMVYMRSGARVVLREVDRHSMTYLRDVQAMEALLQSLSEQMKFQLVVA